MRRQGYPSWRIGLTALCILGAAATAIGAAAQDTEKMRAYRAAFVFKFLKFTQWPPEAFAEQDGPIVVTVLGEQVADHLRELTKSVTVQGRSISVRSLRPPGPNADEKERAAFREALRKSHALYIDTEYAPRVPELLDAVRGLDVLTIAATPRFASRGGMLGLVLDRGRYVFEANPDAIARTRVKVSSQVLELAKVVRDRK